MVSGGRTAVEIKGTTSADGTAIGWRQLGTGPAIVIVHGAISTGEQWLPVARNLAERHTVMLVDRRGRGLSGDTPDYDLSTEVSDVEAVLAAAGPGATLFGHSYGGIVAAATAAAGARISALALYEPPLPVNGATRANGAARANGATRANGSARTNAVTSIASAVAAGDNDRALSIMLTDRVRMAEDAVATLRRSPMWAGMAALAPTLPRELRVIDGLADDVDRFTTITRRTLLLIGTHTAPHQVDATRFLTQNLPTATLVELPEQGHFAHTAVPGTVADAVRSFVDGS